MFFRNEEQAIQGVEKLLAAAPHEPSGMVLPIGPDAPEDGECNGTHRDWTQLSTAQYTYTPHIQPVRYKRRGFMCPTPDVYAVAINWFLGGCTIRDPYYMNSSDAASDAAADIVTHETAHWEAARHVPQLSAMLCATVFADDYLIAPFVLPYGLRAVRAIERASISAAPLLPSPSDLMNLKREFGCTDRTHLVSAIEVYRSQSGTDLRLPDNQNHL